MDLEIKHDIACGLDVHFAVIAACLVRTGPKGGPCYEERSFPTTNRGLKELLAWLLQAGCKAVGMEATGVYWMPIYAALEGYLSIVVGNPTHMKNLRGHKTDRKDAKWIAGLVRHDLIRASFVPTPEFRDARKLTRMRRQLVYARTAIRNEIQRELASIGIPLADVITDVFGASGTRILEALAKGEAVLDLLSTLIHVSLRPKLARITAALESPLSGVAQFALQQGLARLKEVEGHIQEVEDRISSQMQPHRENITRLVGIPGIGMTAACVILAEIGVDMSHWPTERHLSSWAGLAPGNRESAGKRMSAGLMKGNTHLTTIMVEAANAAVKSKKCYLSKVYYRLRARMGHKKAVVAIARKMLALIYKLLSKQANYQEPKQRTDTKASKNKMRKHIKGLESMGFKIALTVKDDSSHKVC